MANYLTTAEINTYLGLSGEDTLVGELNNIVTSKVNSFLGITTLLEATYTDEEYDFNSNGPYYLKQINPTVLTEVDGTAFSGDYKLEGRMLRFYLPLVSNDTIRNKITFTYTAGYATIPDDVKSVCYDLVSLLYNSKKSIGIDSFTQGQISVNYGGDKKDVEEQYILQGLSKYRKNDIYS